LSESNSSSGRAWSSNKLLETKNEQHCTENINITLNINKYVTTDKKVVIYIYVPHHYMQNAAKKKHLT